VGCKPAALGLPRFESWSTDMLSKLLIAAVFVITAILFLLLLDHAVRLLSKDGKLDGPTAERITRNTVIALVALAAVTIAFLSR
jgi:hypothetical protein